MKDSQLKALIKKTAAKAAQPKKQVRPSFDPTLEATRGGKDFHSRHRHRYFPGTASSGTRHRDKDRGPVRRPACERFPTQ